MGLSVERLCVIKDYRSPRSIRSFNKVFVMVLLIVLAPYLVNVGKTSNYPWLPYVLGSVMSLMFSTLLGVQDKLDDPFDGLGQDDINVETLDEWAPVLESVHPKTSVNSKSLFFDIDTPPNIGTEDDRHDMDEEDAEEDSSGVYGGSCDLDYCEKITIQEEPSSPELSPPAILPSSRRTSRTRRKKESTVFLIPQDIENPSVEEQRKQQSVVDESCSALTQKAVVQTHLVRGGRPLSVMSNRRRNAPPKKASSSASIFNFDYFNREDAKQIIKNLIVQKI